MQKDNFTIGNLQLATRLQAFSSNPPFFLTPLDLSFFRVIQAIGMSLSHCVGIN